MTKSARSVWQVTLRSVGGFRVGHAADSRALTGCTVVLCPSGTVGAVEVRGGASGTRELEPLHPLHVAQEVHGVVLAGGSAYGLEAVGGVLRFLEEQGVGFRVREHVVPIVPGAILFDLGIGDGTVRPDPEMGYAACRAASARPPAEGSVGAGIGATVGKVAGLACAMKGGVGTAAVAAGRLRVGALAVVNAFGDVADPGTGTLLAGARRSARSKRFLDTLAHIETHGRGGAGFGEHTTLAVVMTNALLCKPEAHRVARFAQNGLAAVMRPAQTPFDGDTVFVLASGRVPADPLQVGLLAQRTAMAAICRGVTQADGFGILPAHRDLSPLSGPWRPIPSLSEKSFPSQRTKPVSRR